MIVRLMSKSNLPNETSIELVNAILEILEKILNGVGLNSVNANSDLNKNNVISSKEKELKDVNDFIFKYHVSI